MPIICRIKTPFPQGVPATTEIFELLLLRHLATNFCIFAISTYNYMDYIIQLLGAFASIIALIIAIVKKDKTRNTLLYLIILVLCLISAWAFYKYKQETAEKQKINNRKQEACEKAQKLLETFPVYIDHWNPGQNEGLIYAVFSFLENYDDIYPKTFEFYQKDVYQLQDKWNNEADLSLLNEQMEIAGEKAKQTLKGLAQ